MSWVILFCVELAVLFIVSRQMSKTLSSWLMRITRSERKTIQILSFLLLPGVIVHELSHWIVANILFVRTGDIEFLPQIEGDHVKLGSVAIAKTDPFRRLLIGIAPLIIGIAALSLMVFFLLPRPLVFSWELLLFIYCSLQVSNTMFSSRKDMEGAVVFLLTLLVIFIALVIIGVRVDLSIVLSQLPLVTIIDNVSVLVKILAIPLCINLALYGLLSLGTKG